MTQYTTAPFSRSLLPALLDLVAQSSAVRAPGASLMMTSDVAWQLPGSDPKNNIRLWYDGEMAIGYGWYQPPGSFVFDVLPQGEAVAAVRQQMFDWAIARRQHFEPAANPHLYYENMQQWADGIVHPVAHESVTRQLTVPALDSDQALVSQLLNNGFKRSPHFEPHMILQLQEARDAEVDGFSVRSVQAHELETYLACHRAAWAPSTGSSLQRLQAVRALTQVFDPSLNLVAVDNAGQFAACTIFWADPVSLIGSIEPFGTDPAYRGRGVSQLLIQQGLRRLVGKGMTHCRVYTAGFNHQAQRLYASCGFQVIDRSCTYVREC